MKTLLTGLALATLLVATSSIPSRADDVAAPAAATSAPVAPAPQAEAPPPSVARPALVPKTDAQPIQPQATDMAPRPRRHYAHRRYRHYAFWEPIPIYIPNLFHHRIHWSRISWFSF